MSMDKYASRGSMPASLDSSASGKNGGLGEHHRSQSMPMASLSFEGQNTAPVSSMGQSKTDLDSLEDSFKFAVGIAPTHKTSRGKSSSPRTHSGAHTGAVVPGTMSAPSGIAGRSSFDVPEEVLLRDVLYALQAIESRYLYFDDAADRFQITRSVGVPTRKWATLTFSYDESKYSRFRVSCFVLNSHARADSHALRPGLVVSQDFGVHQATSRRVGIWLGLFRQLSVLLDAKISDLLVDFCDIATCRWGKASAMCSTPSWWFIFA